jgi:hypothetical protein
MTEFSLWMAFTKIGAFVAIIAFMTTLLEDYLLSVKGQVFQYLLQSNGPGGI